MNALIKTLKEKADEVRRQDGVICYEGEIYADAFADGVEWAIEQVKNNPGWIPTSERLPEKVGRYLATYVHHRLSVGILTFDPDEEFHVEEWNSTVKAWMPLPKRWKEEKNG